MKIFYFSLAAGSQIKTARELQYPHILINFMTKTNNPPKYHYKTLFIDSGGFHSSLLNGRYTKTDREYLQYIEKVQPTYFALRDYPCEPELLQKHNRTVKDHITMTLNHHIALLDQLPNYNIQAQPIPVLQGWKTEDYLYCLDLYKEHDLITDYTAIGSICRRNATREIRKIITAVREGLPRATRLHGFGVSLSALKDHTIWRSLYSVDSSAWDYTARWKKYRGNISIPQASLLAATQYLQKLHRLHRKHKTQTTLPKTVDEKKLEVKKRRQVFK
jgi:hypothetical protein